MLKGMVHKQYMIVFLSDLRKIEYQNSFFMFASPAKVIAPEPFHFIKVSAKAKRIGPKVNTAKPMKFGAMKLYATRLFCILRCLACLDSLIAVDIQISPIKSQ